MRPRVSENTEQIARYRDDMERGDLFPPIVLYQGLAGDLVGSYLSPSGPDRPRR